MEPTTDPPTASTRRTVRPRPPDASEPGPLVALLIPNLDLGGGERITLLLGHELAELGYEVDVVVGSADGPLRPEVPETVSLVELGVDHLRAGLPPLVRYLRSRRPAALLPTIGHADVLGLVAGRVAGRTTRVLPRISNTLSQLAHDRGSARQRLARRVQRSAYGHAELLVACSHGMASDLVEHVGVPPSRIRVLPNATVGPRQHALAREPVAHPWLRDRSTPTLLTVGSLTVQKNHLLLLDALARVRTRRPVRLVVLGEGPLRPQLEAHVAALDLRDAVDLAGTDPNPFPSMAGCDVFVLSSDWEGLPGVLIEAVACGANVVATDCRSGPREILDGGRHGRLVPTRDPDALAAGILAALDDPIAPPPEAWEPYTAAGSARAYADLLSELGIHA